MAEPALSLVGFMSEPEAVQYLSNSCSLGAGDPVAVWQAAQDRLGEPYANAGAPAVQELPAGHEAYLAGVMSSPRFPDTIGTFPWSFKLVEVAPLLAFQFHVYTMRSDALWGASGNAPTLEQLLPVCLPQALENIPFTVSNSPGSVMIEAQTPNLRLFAGGLVGADVAKQLEVAGALIGAASPLVHVVRFEGRSYLSNGYHRVCAAGRAGINHLPCLLLESDDYARTGALNPNSFGRSLLESANPESSSEPPRV